jgi:hypothetical protein
VKARIPNSSKLTKKQLQAAESYSRQVVKADQERHCGSYGNESDLLEIMGLLTPEEQEFDRVLGNLSAQEVFSRIKTHWDSTQETNNG